MSDGCLEISWTDTDGTVTFRQQDIQSGTESSVDLPPRWLAAPVSGIAAGPTAQSAPERGTGFEVEPVALKTVGCPGLMVSFQNEHAASSPGTQGGTAKTPMPLPITTTSTGSLVIQVIHRSSLCLPSAERAGSLLLPLCLLALAWLQEGLDQLLFAGGWNLPMGPVCRSGEY